MDATQVKNLIAAMKQQAKALTNISNALDRLVILQSIKLTPAQRIEVHETDTIRARQRS